MVGLDTFCDILGDIYGGLVPLMDMTYPQDDRLETMLGVMALVDSLGDLGGQS